MRPLLKGRAVEVVRVTVGSVDGERVETVERETVENVLVCPASTADAGGNARPDADRAAFSLAFPKGYDRPLRNCRVVLDGKEYAIAGDPRPRRENCPTAWWMLAEAAATDG